MESWEQRLKQVLPEFGHRNWIVIADSAYPAQARAGIETLATQAEQAAVVKRVLAALSAARHVTPRICTDRELRFVAEADAPGIGAYRSELLEALNGYERTEMPHTELIARLDWAAQLYRVLVIKTALALPYSSVFVELDCGYWNADAEQRMREAEARAEEAE